MWNTEKTTARSCIKDQKDLISSLKNIRANFDKIKNRDPLINNMLTHLKDVIKAKSVQQI